MLKLVLAKPGGKPLDVHAGIDGKPVLVVESLARLEVHWQTAVITGSTTTTIIEAKPGESVMLTDLIITSTKKVANLDIIVQFDDGTNTIIMLDIEGATAPVNFSHAFSGGVKGWKNASLEVVTDQAVINVTVMIGYLHISKDLTLTYDQWDAAR